MTDPTISEIELRHFADFIDEFEAVVAADTEGDLLIPLYLIERKDIIKQIVEEKLNG